MIHVQRDERKRFWNALFSVGNDPTEKSSKIIAEAIPKINEICRFRTVNDSSLKQLQDNKLFFSSANYYDDPFDTFIHFDREKINAAVATLSQLIHSSSAQQLVSTLVAAFGIDPNDENLAKELTSMQTDTQFAQQLTIHLQEGFLQVRKLIQQTLFSICFCDDPLNESLWIKYANSHKGFVAIYDVTSPKTFLCGTYIKCKQCIMNYVQPYLYPVYYSDDSYDATEYALNLILCSAIPNEYAERYPDLINTLQMKQSWEVERISLIKKKCHEHDHEWRLINRAQFIGRPVIKLKPTKIALGLNMEKYEKQLVISAAKIAGISSINEMYINDDDRLAMRHI